MALTGIDITLGQQMRQRLTKIATLVISWKPQLGLPLYEWVYFGRT